LKNFKPFREEQIIDFSSLDFFVIRGPTGSGKSSILDAIMFALYGPKNVKGQKYEDLVHKGSRYMKVDFTFKVRGTTYRIEWQVSAEGKKGFSGEPRFYVDGTRKLISTKALVKEIEKILGVNREQFQKIFYLPQGRYDQFLKGDARQRREILISLLDLDIYQKISERAKEERRDLEKQLANIEGQLQGLNDISEKLLEELKANLYQLQRDINRLSKMEKELNENVKLLEEKEKFFFRYRELKREIEHLKGEEIEKLEKTVKQLKPYYNYYGELTQYTNLLKELKAKREYLRKVEDSLKNFQEKKADIKRKLEKLQDYLNKLSKEKEFVERLKEIEKELLLLIDRLEKLSKEKKELIHLEKEIERTSSLLKDLKNQHLKILKRIETYQEELEKIHYDPEKEIELLRKKLKAEEKRDKEKYLDELKKSLEVLEREFKEKEKQLKKVEEELKTSENELETLKKLRKDYLVYLLLQEVKEGEICPICGNVIENKKQHKVNEKFNSKRFKELELQIQKLQSKKIKLQTELENLEKQIEEKKREIETLYKELIKLSDIPTTEFIENEIDKLKRVKAEKDKKEKELNKLLEEIRKIENELKTLEGSLAEKENLRKNLKKTINEETNDIKETFKKLVKEVYGNEAPKGVSLKVFLQSVKEKINSYEGKLNQLEEEKRKLELQNARYEEKIALERKHLEELKIEIANLQEELETLKPVLEDLNLNDEELPKLIEELKVFSKLESELNRRKESLHQKEAELKSIEQQLGNFSEKDLERLEQLKRQLEEVRKELEELKGKEAVLKNRIKEISKNLKLKGKLEKDKKLLEERLAILETLIKDFQSNNLIDFVIGTALNDIIEIASDYFYRLSERYRFENQKGNILVKDLYNNTTRAIESLSGGETFLASLSFALGLGEFLSSNAAVESIFIDEGFGTLDRDILNKIGELFGVIRKRINKTVGVITHVEALADLFDQQIYVIPSPKGSKIEVVNVQ